MDTLEYKIVEMSFDDGKFQRDELLDSLFRKVRIKAFASGSNAHTLPVDVDVLKRAAYTIYNQPILWKYSKALDDAMSHEKDEVPCGFVPKENNSIEFLEENDRVYIVINALLWTRYSGRLVEIFERDHEKSVSVEMACDTVQCAEGDSITDYVISGITILGEWVNPAVKGCKAELINFAEDQEKFLKMYNFAEDTIQIVNTKESAVNGKWDNPRRKLLSPILKASNKTALLNEAYLIPDLENPTVTNCKYPHHVIRDGKLVLHIRGVQAAFARAEQQGIVQGKVKAHLLRHYRELGLTTQNFAEFGFSEECFNTYFRQELEEGERQMDNKFAIEGREAWGDVIHKVQEHEGKGAYVDSVEKDHIIYTKDNVRYRVEADVSVGKDDKTVSASIKWDTVKKDKDQKMACNSEEKDMACKDDKQMSKDAHTSGGVADEYDDDTTKKEDVEQKEEDDEDFSQENFAKMKAELKELKEKFAKLSADNAVYMAKCEAMSDYEELKQFKCDAEAKAKQEEQMCKMNKVFDEMEEKGAKIDSKHREELVKKFAECGSVELWSNYVKAFVFDNYSGSGEQRIAFAQQPETTRASSIWDEF